MPKLISTKPIRRGNTALTLAAERGMKDLVLNLLQLPSILIQGKAIELADKNNHREIAEIIHDKVVKIGLNASLFEAIAAPNNPEKYQTIQDLIAQGAELNTHNAEDETPLMLAARQNDVELATILFNHQTLILSYINARGRSAERIAEEMGSTEILEIIEQRRQILNESLIDHISSRDLTSEKKCNISQQLLLLGASPNAVNQHGNSALMIAAFQGDLALAQKFISHPQITLNYRNENHQAINIATDNDTPEIVEAIEQRRQNFNQRMLKAFHNPQIPTQRKSACVTAMLERGADPDAKNDQGVSALMLAVTQDDFASVQALCRYGVRIDREALQSAQDHGFRNVFNRMVFDAASQNGGRSRATYRDDVENILELLETTLQSDPKANFFSTSSLVALAIAEPTLNLVTLAKERLREYPKFSEEDKITFLLRIDQAVTLRMTADGVESEEEGVVENHSNKRKFDMSESETPEAKIGRTEVSEVSAFVANLPADLIRPTASRGSTNFDSITIPNPSPAIFGESTVFRAFSQNGVKR